MVVEAKPSTKGRKSSAANTSKPRSGSGGLSIDPLSSALEGVDPLSALAATQPSHSIAGHQKSTNQRKDSLPREIDDTFEPWSSKRTGILNKFTTSEKLSITTSFLPSGDKDRVVITKPTTTTVSDKVKNRLEQLDDFEEGSVKEMLNLSQQDYMTRIEELNQALICAWNRDQRVKALKIAIQCAKMLADTAVVQFYPSKFVLITDVLDTFGRLVYDRIKEKSSYLPPGGRVPIKLPANFTPDKVPESAKETCRNWFYKIASIRELIPRIYVEMAIMRCYGYLDQGEYSNALNKLTQAIRGIGDPLVSIYARCYLSRVGMVLAPNIHNHLLPCFNDFLSCYSQLQGDSVQNMLALQRLEMPQYLTLYSPALDWLLQCIAHNSSEETLIKILDKCQKQCNSALLLNSIMGAFKPEYVANKAIQFTEMIKECEETGFPKHYLHRSLGLCLVLADPPDNQKLSLLNEVWKVVMKLKNPTDYISCAEVWIEYVVKHFGKREVNTILGDITKHMTPDRAFEDFYPQLQSVVTKILSHQHDFSVLFTLEKFLPFIDMFQKDSVKTEVCKNITESFIKYQTESTNDPVILNAMMFVCKTMHDSVNALTLDDDRRVISNLICGFIHKVSFGRDFEQQLSYYVECRASFSNLDLVLVELIQKVNSLSMHTRNVVKGNHSRKTAAFVRACAAYCFITVPSLENIFTQLDLYLLSGQVALLNQCLSQADANFKAAISLLADVPKVLDFDGKIRSTDSMFVTFVSNFLSTLLVVPDNPDQGVLYLVRGLLNVLQDYSWEPNSTAKITLYIKVLAMLSAVSQDDYPYHVDKVDSNDAMYGSDPKFLNEVQKVCGTLLSEVLNQLTTLQDGENLKKQSALALDLFMCLVAHGDMEQESMFLFAINLWGLAQKHGLSDTKVMVRHLDYVKKKGRDNKKFQELASKMPLLQTRT